jgi:hypothetical protein
VALQFVGPQSVAVSVAVWQRTCREQAAGGCPRAENVGTYRPTASRSPGRHTGGRQRPERRAVPALLAVSASSCSASAGDISAPQSAARSVRPSAGARCRGRSAFRPESRQSRRVVLVERLPNKRTFCSRQLGTSLAEGSNRARGPKEVACETCNAYLIEHLISISAGTF